MGRDAGLEQRQCRVKRRFVPRHCAVVRGEHAAFTPQSHNPVEGVSDIYRTWRFPGGIPESTFYVQWQRRNITALTAADAAAMMDPVASQKDLRKNPQLEKIIAPALICGSWSDHGVHTRGCFEAFKRISSEHKWLYTHGRKKWEEYYSDEAIGYQKKFFDYFLKGIDNGIGHAPSRLEVRETKDTYVVRYENEWPIARLNIGNYTWTRRAR